MPVRFPVRVYVLDRELSVERSFDFVPQVDFMFLGNLNALLRNGQRESVMLSIGIRFHSLDKFQESSTSELRIPRNVKVL